MMCIFLSSGTVGLACVIPHAGLIGCLRAGIAVRSALHTLPGWFQVGAVHKVTSQYAL